MKPDFASLLVKINCNNLVCEVLLELWSPLQMQGFIIIIVVILDHLPPLQVSYNVSNVLKTFSEALGFCE